MRKISEILYKKFRPAVFIKWGLGRNSTSSALARLARKTYLASQKDFSWPPSESLRRNADLSLKHTMWTICVEKCHLWPHTWYLLDLRLAEEKCSQRNDRRRTNWLRTFSHQQHSLKSMFLPLLLMQIRSSDINVALWFNLSSSVDRPSML